MNERNDMFRTIEAFLMYSSYYINTSRDCFNHLLAYTIDLVHSLAQELHCSYSKLEL